MRAFRDGRRLPYAAAGLATIAAVVAFSMASCGVPTDPKPVQIVFKAPASTATPIPAGTDTVTLYFVKDGSLVPVFRHIQLPGRAEIPREHLTVRPIESSADPTTTRVDDEPLDSWEQRIADAQRQVVFDKLAEGVTPGERQKGLGSSLERVGLGNAERRPVAFDRLDRRRGVAYLVFGETFKLEGATGDDFRLALAQLVYTATELSGVGRVVFQQVAPGGKSISFVNTQNAQGVASSKPGTPLSRQDFAEFLPEGTH